MTAKGRALQNMRRVALILFDLFSVALAGYGALLLRFNGSVVPRYFENYTAIFIFTAASCIVIFALLRLYSSLWQFASIVELRNLIAAAFLGSIVNLGICEITGHPMPRSCYVIFFLILTMFLGGSRFFYRLLRLYRRRRSSFAAQAGDVPERVMIVGAGAAGEKVYREIVSTAGVHKKAVCFIDDDPSKWGRSLHGVPVYGGREKILEAAERFEVQEILVSIPSADRRDIADILTICNDARCRVKKLPGIYQMINDEIHISDFKEVDILDLLGREPIQVNLEEIMDYVTDKVVMVTGGGGSIGSEICRQIAEKNPRQLIIVDIYENNAYEIQQELKRSHPELDLKVMIASVRNARKINKLFETYRPDIVYHAAAHKHVPLMEDAPNEAVKNNVFGTLNVVKAADRYYSKRFILISTDKAVNPTNIMGATKRICEMIVQAYDKKSETDYVAVRFGNVLGSNGSVIPLFERQIREGGPVTVTHPDIIRYFMTIPEAVSLVLQAGAYARGGEIFVLDMGEPVKIADMAKNLIKLSGLEPGVDIQIEYTGLRPGEKLYEELLMDEEGLQDTPNHTIHIGKPIVMDEDSFFERLQALEEDAYQEADDIRMLVGELVPTYTFAGAEAADTRTTAGAGAAVGAGAAESMEDGTAVGAELAERMEGGAGTEVSVGAAESMEDGTAAGAEPATEISGMADTENRTAIGVKAHRNPEDGAGAETGVSTAPDTSARIGAELAEGKEDGAAVGVKAHRNPEVGAAVGAAESMEVGAAAGAELAAGMRDGTATGSESSAAAGLDATSGKRLKDGAGAMGVYMEYDDDPDPIYTFACASGAAEPMEAADVPKTRGSDGRYRPVFRKDCRETRERA